MTRLYLIRHCEAEGNKLRRCHSAYDSGITLNGRRQIEALRQRFAGERLDAVYASDMYRARETARPLAEDRGLELRLVPALREMQMGKWEDMAWGTIAHDDEAGERTFTENPHAFDCRTSGGESLWGVSCRVMRALSEIGDRHDGQTVAVTFHGTALRAFLCRALGMPWERLCDVQWCDNTGVNLIEYESGAFRVVSYNDNSHLTRAQSTVMNQSWYHKQVRWQDIYLWYRRAEASDLSAVAEACRAEGGLAAELLAEARNTAAASTATAANAARVAARPVAIAGMLGEQTAGLFLLEAVPQENTAPAAAAAPAQQPIPADTAFLRLLYVLPEYRGRRFGEQLLGEAISLARRAGKRTMRIQAEAGNARALAFLADNEFAETGREGGLMTLEKQLWVDSLL